MDPRPPWSSSGSTSVPDVEDLAGRPFHADGPGASRCADVWEGPRTETWKKTWKKQMFLRWKIEDLWTSMFEVIESWWKICSCKIRNVELGYNYATLHCATTTTSTTITSHLQVQLQLHCAASNRLSVPSVGSLCHPSFTPTNLCYRFPIFETSATGLCGTYWYNHIQESYSHTALNEIVSSRLPYNIVPLGYIQAL